MPGFVGNFFDWGTEALGTDVASRVIQRVIAGEISASLNESRRKEHLQSQIEDLLRKDGQEHLDRWNALSPEDKDFFLMKKLEEMD